MTVYSRCHVCGEEVVMGDEPVQHECYECGKDFVSNYYCKNEHYLCNTCASKPLYEVAEKIYLSSKSKNPIAVADEIMAQPEFTMLGCKHIIVTLIALMTAFKNSGGKVPDIESFNHKMNTLTSICPTSMCKLGGFCGIPISVGISLMGVISMNVRDVKGTTLANKLTNYCLTQINNPNNSGESNCCKRNTYITIAYASKFISSNLWVEMDVPDTIKCKYSDGNPKCNKSKCPFFNGWKIKV